MLYRLIADLLVLVHLGFILFVIFGGFLAVRWKWLIWLHVPAACWGAAIEFGGWICPLTPWENHFRQAGGETGYAGGFIEHYIVPIIYPGNLTRLTQVVLGLLVVVINAVAYTVFFRRHFDRRTGTQGDT